MGTGWICHSFQTVENPVIIVTSDDARWTKESRLQGYLFYKLLEIYKAETETRTPTNFIPLMNLFLRKHVRYRLLIQIKMCLNWHEDAIKVNWV